MTETCHARGPGLPTGLPKLARLENRLAADPLRRAEAEQLRACADLVSRDPQAATAQLRDYLKKNPLSAEAYRLLAAAKDAGRPGTVMSGGIVSAIGSNASMRLMQAAQALQADDLETAEIALR